MSAIRMILSVALAALFGATAHAAIVADRPDVAVEVGQQVVVTLTNTSTTKKTLSLGSWYIVGDHGDYTGNGFTASLSSTSIEKNGGTVALTIRGTAATTAQKLNVFRSDKPFEAACTITVTVTKPQPRKAVTVSVLPAYKFVGAAEPIYCARIDGVDEADPLELSWRIWRTNLVDGVLCDEPGTCDLLIDGPTAVGIYDISYVSGELTILQDDPLPPISPDSPDELAEVLKDASASLRENLTTVEAYADFRTWVQDRGIDPQKAKTGEAAFFSFATDQKGLVDAALISTERIEVRNAELAADGAFRLTVGVADLPVGEKARAAYLRQVFGVRGCRSVRGDFLSENVVYRQTLTNDGNGTVSCSVVPNVSEGDGMPSAFFFRPTVVK